MKNIITHNIKSLVTFFDRFFKPYDWVHSYFNTHHVTVDVPIHENMHIDEYYALTSLIENKSELGEKILVITNFELSGDFKNLLGSHSVVIVHTSSMVESDLLLKLNKLKSASFDSVIVCYTLNDVLEYEKILHELNRLVRKGGSCLVIACSIAQVYKKYTWGFTGAALEYVCSKVFTNAQFKMRTYGNVLVGRHALEGTYASDIDESSLKHSDMYFPVVASVLVQSNVS